MEHRVLGVLYLWLQGNQAISAHKRRVVESLATHAAVVLERERLTRAETQAQALAEAGAEVAIVSRTLADCQQAADEIAASAGQRATAFAADVAKLDDIERLAEAAFGGLSDAEAAALSAARLDQQRFFERPDS